MRNRNKRILWLLNHRTLMAYEAKLLVALGYEVFIPKSVPATPDFRSTTITYDFDERLTIPRHVLERLNRVDFYEGEWPDDVVAMLNRYFGAAFFLIQGRGVEELVHKFEGRILLRVFGITNAHSYKFVLETIFGRRILSDIHKLGDRFWFAQAYEQLAECEPPLFADRQVFLPVGLPESQWRNADTYTGVDKRILFVCPNVVSIPYYRDIYRQFKAEFGDLPHVIFGAQDVPVDDPHMLGYVTDAELERLYRDSAVIYYHSRELRHLHYSPIEASINGMPVVYYADSLLGRLTPEISLGRVETTAEARASVERILSGDVAYADAMRADQRTLQHKFTDAYCRPFWEENLHRIGLGTTPEPNGTVLPRELRRSLLRPFAHGQADLPRDDDYIAPPLEVFAVAGETLTAFEGDIDFTKDYPWNVSVTGLSAPEPFGRWTDGPDVAIHFDRPLPPKFRLVLEGGGYGPNVGARIKVKAGTARGSFVFRAGPWTPHRVTLDLHSRHAVYTIALRIPRPVRPPNDNRAVGLGLKSLRIEDLAPDASAVRAASSATS